MKGDFSRLNFSRLRHYTRVLMQQGRVQLDADWNEQAELGARQVASALGDLIGPHGAPKDGQDFAVTVRHALEFDGQGGHAEVAADDVFNFHQREPFTFALWVLPARGGTLLARVGETGEAAYALAVDSDGRVAFHRDEPERPADPGLSDEPELKDQPGSAAKPEPHAKASHEARVGHQEFRHIRSSGRPPRVMRTLTAAREVVTDRFSYVVVTFDGQIGRILIDGEVAAESHAWATAPPTRGHLTLGGAAGEGFPAFSGALADVRVWCTALTPEQVRATYESGLQPETETIVADWGFDRIEENVVHDRSGNGRALQLRALAGELPYRSNSIWIGPGRYYVEGVVSENDRSTLFTRQPDYPGASLPPTPSETTHFLVYLEAWDRYISALEDPTIADPALGGVDTTGRVKNVWQVKLLPVNLAGEIPADADFPEWRELRRRHAQRGTLAARNVPAGTTLQNQLYRVEIHAPSAAEQGGMIVEARVLSERLLTVHRWTLDGLSWAAGQVLEITPAEASHSGPPAVAALVTKVDETQRILEVDELPAVVKPGHRVRLRRAATFKWSRENGAVAFPIAAIDYTSGTVRLSTAPRDSYSLRTGDLVEVGDDSTTLLGVARPLSRIADLNPAEGTVSLVPPPPNIYLAGHPYLRRWDQSPATAPNLKQGVVPLLPGQWIDLESGIQVHFAQSGAFQTGDYWLIPARTIPAAIDWPHGDSGPEPRSPDGITRRLAPLALLAYGPHGPAWLCSYRETFDHLTALSSNEENFVRKTGDRMTGPLVVDSNLDVTHNLTTRDLAVEGEARVALLSGRLAPGLVGTEQLQDGAVTLEKLAFVIEPVVPGDCVVDSRPQPPPGYHYSGSSLLTFTPTPLEVRGEVLPLGQGRLTAVAIHHHVYVLYDSGAFWRFDLGTREWHPLCPLEPGRRDFAMVALHGQVYVIGGHIAGQGTVGLNHAYDPAIDSWIERAAMPSRRRGMAGVADGGHIHLFGGERRALWGRRATAAHQIFDPASESWEELPPMGRRRAHAAAVNRHGVLHVIGGERCGLFGRHALAAHEVYDPRAQRWALRSPLIWARTRFGLGVLDGKLYALGGERPLPFGLERILLRDSDQYSPAFDAWNPVQPLPVPLAGFSVVTVANRLYGVCGVIREQESSALIIPLATVYYIHQKINEKA